MNIKTVWAVWFSGTGTTEKTVRRIADGLAAALKAERKNFNFTPPEARQQERTFSQEDLVVFGTPVYAGRVPNVLLPYLTGKIRGGGALAVVFQRQGGGINMADSIGQSQLPGQLPHKLLVPVGFSAAQPVVNVADDQLPAVFLPQDSQKA